MNRIANAALNWVLNFLLGFAAGSLVSDRRTGVRVGAVLGTLSAAVTLLLAGRVDEERVEAGLEDAVEVPIE